MGQCRICNSTTNKGYRRDRKPWCSSGEPFVYVCDACKSVACRKFNKKRGRTGRTVEVPSFDEWLSVLEEAWDSTDRCFRCQISRVRLCLDDRSSPVYPSLEHADNGQYMVVATVINDMKSDLTLAEFRDVVTELAKQFGGDDQADLDSRLANLSKFRRH